MKKYTYKDSDMYDIYPPGSEVGITHAESICKRCKNFVSDENNISSCSALSREKENAALKSGVCKERRL